MATVPRRSIRLTLGEARRKLGMSQRKFGYAIGSSHRSAVRWDAGKATPAQHHLQKLARLLHPIDRDLAAEVANAAGETLESLGLEAPAPAAPAPVAPAAPALGPDDLIDIVVLSAVELSGATPAAARAWLHAAFKRGHELGLTMDVAERALRPSSKRATKVDG
jgi:transcriptional regulator with XRE-family HTH domain